eukprot:8741184-Alexandrium_andersonii.AAC.1
MEHARSRCSQFRPPQSLCSLAGSEIRAKHAPSGASGASIEAVPGAAQFKLRMFEAMQHFGLGVCRQIEVGCRMRRVE